MKLRWQLVAAAWLVAAAAGAAADARDEHEVDDSTPDADFDGEDDFSLDEEESRNLRPRAYTQTSYAPNNLPSGFRPSPEIGGAGAEATLAPQLQQLQQLQQRRPLQQTQEQEYINLIPIRTQQQLYDEQPTRQPARQPARAPHTKFQEQRAPPQNQEQLEEELEEKEEPDRLSLLLQQSKFDCVSRQTGYYADEELNCEVFHYCHDSVKHSWICPNGFTFHQVHLICMPPSGDSICQRSSKYHFVNDYLYRPINAEEVERKPNVTLRYSDRYYPTDIYNDDRYNEDNEEDQQLEPVRPRNQQQQQLRQQQQRHQPAQQVFRSAEEVNIPLVQRRPHSGFAPTQRPYTTPADFDYQ